MKTQLLTTADKLEATANALLQESTALRALANRNPLLHDLADELIALGFTTAKVATFGKWDEVSIEDDSARGATNREWRISKDKYAGYWHASCLIDSREVASMRLFEGEADERNEAAAVAACFSAILN